MKAFRRLPLWLLVLPLAFSLLVCCITAGYAAYRIAKKRDYLRRWKFYEDCGLG